MKKIEENLELGFYEERYFDFFSSYVKEYAKGLKRETSDLTLASPTTEDICKINLR